MIEGKGAFQLNTPKGFTAELAVKVVPLNLAVDGLISVDHKKIVLGLSVDLPGPIPIANTGLGLFGIGGAFGINARPSLPPPGADPVLYQLSWDHTASGAFALYPDDFTYGFEAVIGTAPDIGFSFSAKGGVFLTVPDIVIRGALDGHMMSPRPMLSERPEQAPPGLSYRGVIVVDLNDGVTFGLRGLLNLRPIVEVEVPIGARFPFDDPSEWYIYIGTDGYNDGKGRALGPVRATILPDLPLAHADAYVMLRGAGIEKWPRGGGITIIDGFVIAFGFTFEIPLGFKPVAWGEIHASADVLLASRPLLIADSAPLAAASTSVRFRSGSMLSSISSSRRQAIRTFLPGSAATSICASLMSRAASKSLSARRKRRKCPCPMSIRSINSKARMSSANWRS